MGDTTLLTAAELDAALDRLPGWTLAQGRLRWERRFRDFVEAFGFMSQVALVAESMNHHPDWRNSWATVSVELTTHDAGGVTMRDLELARRISELAGPEPAPRAV